MLRAQHITQVEDAVDILIQHRHADARRPRSDDAAPAADLPRHGETDEPRMRRSAPFNMGVRAYHWPRANLHCRRHRRFRRMRQIDHHTQPVHLADHVRAERRKPARHGRGRLDVTHLVGPVMHQRDRPHIVPERARHIRDVPRQEVRAFHSQEAANALLQLDTAKITLGSFTNVTPNAGSTRCMLAIWRS